MYLDISNGLEHQDILRQPLSRSYCPSIELFTPPSLVEVSPGPHAKVRERQ